MNSDTRRILRQFDSRGGPDMYQRYSEGQLQDRFTSPTAIATLILLAVTVSYQAAYQQGRVPSVPHLLWDIAVYVIPARLLYAIESFTDPPLFPTPMFKAQSSTHAAKSDLMRKILRLDKPGGFLSSVSQAGRLGLSSWSGGRATAERPPGLGNYDNACYQNSIIQGLASLHPLPNYLSALPLDKSHGLPPSQTADALRTMIDNLHGPSNHGKTFWTPQILKNMSTWQQQDAQEYYSKLLDQIDKEIAKIVSVLQKRQGFEADCPSDDSSNSQRSFDSGYHSSRGRPKPQSRLQTSRNPLEGLMAQRVACVACGHCEGLTMIPFNCLTLSLGDSSEHDIYERLEHYTKLEAIGGVECVKCTLLDLRDGLKMLFERAGELPELRQRLEFVEEALEEGLLDDKTLTACKVSPRLKVSSTKTKQVAIARPPQSLVFHMNRSVFDEKTGYMFKNSAAVRFPMTLDLGPWCLGSAGGKVNWKEGDGEGAPPTGQDEEQWPLDPKTSMVAGDRQPSRIVGPIYELRAVVTHHGHHEAGHYVCYRRHPASSSPAADTPKDKKPEEPSESDAPEADATSISPPSHHGAESAGEGEERRHGEEKPSLWWRFSDETVTEVHETTVLNQAGVFMLFYDCVDPNSVLVHPEEEMSGTSCSVQNQTFPDAAALVANDEAGVAKKMEGLNSRDSAVDLRGGDGVLAAEGESVLSEALCVPLPDEMDGL